MFERRTRAALISLALLFATGAQADQLTIPQPMPEIQGQKFSVAMPITGMSMDQVKHAYGNPQRILPAVGDPPITRWVYAQYTVYFERQYVINSVLNRH